jgi:hypothetical protein
MAFTENAYSAKDLRKVKEAVKKFPPKMSRASMAAQLSAEWNTDSNRIERWITIASSFSDDTIDLFEKGKISRNCLNEIAKSKYPNPSYKDFVAQKAVEFNLSKKDLEEIHVHLNAGRHPVEAIEIVRGIRSEKPITKNDAMSIDRIVKEWERDGFAWRQRAEIIRQQGKIQVLQEGQLKSRILYSLAAMKVATDDMRRYIDELWREVPPDMQKAFEAEFRGEPQVVEEQPAQEIEAAPALPEASEGAKPEVSSEL